MFNKESGRIKKNIVIDAEKSSTNSTFLEEDTTQKACEENPKKNTFINLI